VLTRIEVMPSVLTIDFGANQQFTARGYDQHDNPMDPLDYLIWMASGGEINKIAVRLATAAQQALYTAGNLPGHYEVVAAVGEIEGRAQVEITGDPPPDLPPASPTSTPSPPRAAIPTTTAITPTSKAPWWSAPLQRIWNTTEFGPGIRSFLNPL